MEVEKQTNESSITDYNSSDHELSFSSDSEVIKSKSSTEILKDNDGDDKTEQEKSGVDSKEDDLQCSSKNFNIRESHETSPFKQAVKGFVLSKLSKKVGSSHILSGITEKIVKKLEDNRDNSQPILVHNSGSDLSLSSLKASETSEVLSSSLSCELKSVVANDLALLEVLNVEDAVECVEERKSLINNTDVDTKIPQRSELRSSSISLPCSPAHCINKRSSSVSYSLESVQLTKKNMHSPNLSFLCEENRCNDKISKFENHEHKEKEIDIKEKCASSSFEDDIIDSQETYPNNVYSSKKEDRPLELKKNMLKEIYLLVLFLKNELTSLQLSHFFLLALIIIHNIDIISSYIAFIFDGIVIAYVCYSYICIVVQKPIPIMSNFPFDDPQLENASLCIQKANHFLKGSVKVLKGEYDPEMVKNHPTDLVDISIENCCLKIYAPKKKSKDVSTNLDCFTFYDLLGANVSIVPKDLSKKRMWNRKYPVCITFSSLNKNSNTDDFEKNNDEDSMSTEYLSIAKCENCEIEKKALYLFALTDREKELFFWALQKNTESNDAVNSSEQSSVPSKPDLSSMSYASLLDLNNDDDISQSKDEDENSAIIDKTNVDLDFEYYMRNLFENFEKMNKFTPRSRSFEELSSLKDDVSRSSEAHFSKDDSFLSTSTKAFSVDWLNVACGRVFYDFLTQKKWNDDIKARIQKKLDKIEMPTFIESLEVTDVYLGTSLPQVYTVSNPITDIYGVWFNCDFNYCGSFQMTLKAKLKMAKAKQFSSDSLYATDVKQNVIENESSDEEGSDSKSASPRKKKLINRIEKWISHKHFQTVAQSRFVKKYVGDISNMPLTLTVEVNSLHGTLSINIPPAPTDRIWYGFRKNPVLSLHAYPKVGTHEINLSAIVQMIEKKLIQEFKKAIVLPNMDDLLIPVMHTPVYEL